MTETALKMANPLARVAVVGGGPQGLCALKNLREEGFDATVLEQRDCIGGLWAYSDDPSIATVLRSTVGNVSKWRNCYSDFPIAREAPVYLDQKQFLQYLESYAEHFQLRPHIRLRTRVDDTQRDAAGHWQLTLSSTTPEGNVTQTTERFAKIVLATGQYNKPEVPKLDGATLFRGPVMHSQEFKNPADLAGKRVLVVGFGCTAADTASELATVAQAVYVSHRRGILVFRRIFNDCPMDLQANFRIASLIGMVTTAAPILSQSLLHRAGLKLSDSSFDLDPKWNFRPAPSVTEGRGMISDTFVPLLRAGKINSVGGVTRFTGPRSAAFADGTTVDVDAVVFCTGYQIDRSLHPGREIEHDIDDFEAALPETGTRLPRLYQNMFPPEHGGSVAYMNSWLLPTGICEVADLMSMAVTQIWKGNFSLPSVEEMHKEINRHHAWVKECVPSLPSSTVRTVHEAKWRAWLHEAAGTGVPQYLGYGVSGWLYWLRDRSFCNTLMGGVNSPHIYRLFDGRRKQWPEARKAILEANEDFKAHFATGSSKRHAE